MREITVQQLIKAKFSGTPDQSFQYMNLIVEATVVLVAGIVLWRVSALFHKRKQSKRSVNSKFETIYSKEWKKRL